MKIGQYLQLKWQNILFTIQLYKLDPDVLEIPRAMRATFLAPAEGCSFGPSALTSVGWEQFVVRGKTRRTNGLTN